MAKIFIFAAAISAFALVQAGVCLAQQSADPSPGSPPPLRIGAGDLIEINMYDNPDLSGHFRVNEKGDITIPLLGLVHVEGDTAEEVGTTIEKRYVEADILRPFHARATVFVAEYATQGITVSGQVKTAGLYPALGVRMLNDVIAAAGGVTVFASSKVTITHRSDPGHPITVSYNPEALSPEIPQVQLFPGDTIMVPRAGVIYVLGKVAHPGAYILESRVAMSVEKAMALAGSSGPSAAMSRAHLVRTLDDGRKEDIILNVDKIQASKAPDVAMKDGDVLFIPTSNVKLVMLQGIQSALNISSSVVVYRTSTQSQ